MSEFGLRLMRGARVCACFMGMAVAVAEICAAGQAAPNQTQPSPTQQQSQTHPAVPPPNPAPTAPVQGKSVNSDFQLDVESSAASGSVSLTRPADGITSLNLIYSGSADTKAQITTSPFTSDNGDSIRADILSNCAIASSKQSQPVAITAQPNEVIPLCLFVPPLPTAKVYSGRLIINSSAGALNNKPTIKTINFSSPASAPGTLVLDQNAESQLVSRSFWTGRIEATFSVRAGEKTGEMPAVPLKGVSVRLESVGNSPNNSLDLNKNVTFAWRGLEPDGSISAGKQATVIITIHDLNPGDYSSVLRFSATNSAPDDAQKLQISVHVRDSIWRAVLWLLLAVAISFTATKVLTTLQRRARLLTQIRALQPQWFSSLPPIAPVVWLRAVLHQTQRLSKQFWLTSPDLIEANLSDAQRMLAVLDAVRQLRDKLEVMLDALVYRRVAIGLDQVVSRLGMSPLNDAAVQAINSELSAFSDWLSSDKFPSLFWNDIQPALESLQNEMAGWNPPASIAQAVIQEIDDLRQAISDALTTPPTTRPAVEQVYQQYAKLRILFDQRDDLGDLSGPEEADIYMLFAAADQRDWNRIKPESLQIRLPRPADVDGLEAFQVLQFAVTASDPAIESTYFFRHKVEFQWEFRLTPEQTRLEKLGWRRRPGDMFLQPVSLGPTVVQYFPRPCTVEASVTLVYGNEPKPIAPAGGLAIYPSSDFQPFKILAGTEVVSWAISVITALATGLGMFYLKGTSWGSYQDYLTLLLWGMGVDQGKTFLQALQSNSPPTSTPAAH